MSSLIGKLVYFLLEDIAYGNAMITHLRTKIWRKQMSWSEVKLQNVCATYCNIKTDKFPVEANEKPK